MAFAHKKNSIIKNVLISDVEMVKGQSIAEHGIVFVGDRAGVVFDKTDSKSVSVYFDTNMDFITGAYDEGNLPRIGGKAYLNSEGKLSSDTNGKYVGFYWGLDNGGAVFSLGL